MRVYSVCALALLAACAADVGVDADQKAAPVCAPIDVNAIAAATSAELGGEPQATTASRAAWLTRYAHRLLEAEDCEVNERLAARDLRADPLTGPAGYRVEVRGERDGCFDDSGDWSLTEDANFTAARTQIDRFASFLRDFHIAMDGRRTFFFDTVRFCPRSGWPSLYGGDNVFSLDASVLTVGIWQGNWLGDIEADSGRDMRADWKSGGFMPAGPLRKYWGLANPISSGRVIARRIVREGARRLGVELDRAVGEAGVSDQARVPRQTIDIGRLVQQTLSKAFGGGPIADRASEAAVALARRQGDVRARITARLGDAEPAQLAEVARVWKEFISNQDHVSSISQSLIATNIMRSSYDIQVNQILCGIAHGNFHNISVNIDALLPKARTFMKYAELRQVPQNIRANQWLNAVCTYSVDEVNIAASLVGGEGTIELAGLEYAMDAVLGPSQPEE